MKFGFQIDIGVTSSFPILKFYPAVAIFFIFGIENLSPTAAIFYSKWPPKLKNSPISMKFGFQVDIVVASSFPVSKKIPA